MKIRNKTVGETTNKNVINLDNGNFFDGIVNSIEHVVNGMECPFAELTLPRQLVHDVAHQDFGMSKVMLLNELVRRLNEKYNRIGLYSLWECGEDGFKVLTMHKNCLTPAGKEYFNIK